MSIDEGGACLFLSLSSHNEHTKFSHQGFTLVI